MKYIVTVFLASTMHISWCKSFFRINNLFKSCMGQAEVVSVTLWSDTDYMTPSLPPPD